MQVSDLYEAVIDSKFLPVVSNLNVTAMVTIPNPNSVMAESVTAKGPGNKQPLLNS